MAETPEGKIKRKITEWIIKQWPNAYVIRYPAGRFGRSGVPDLICSIEGIFVAIEAKTEYNNPTKLQELELRKVKRSNGIAVIIRGYDTKKLNLLKEILNDKIQRLYMASPEGS